MNIAAAISGPTVGATELAIAGETALCDPRGVLFFPQASLLVVSDLHLEKGSSFARRGMLAPPYDTGSTLGMLDGVLRDYRPRIVVSLGDSFHDRQGAERLPAVYREALLDMLAGRDWYWIAGNHDPDVPHDLPGECVHELSFGGLVFRHEPQAGSCEGEIAGHLHPGARIVRRGRSVRRPCFASDGRRLIMPAFGAYTGMLNIRDRAYAGLFAAESLVAYMMGRDRVYSIAGSALRAG
ncbi:MAG: ligase-associated DNA damage response endonuclease PdeM [Rhizobiaceae bacterium]|nr:ligase-associated DNA damage response endonuclease PdeM [Rhizobiaceae bacterium]